MNIYLRLQRSKRPNPPQQPRPAASVIAGNTEVSAPGAAIRVVRVDLTPEGRQLLQSSATRIA